MDRHVWYKKSKKRLIDMKCELLSEAHSKSKLNILPIVKSQQSLQINIHLVLSGLRSRSRTSQTQIS